MPLLVSQARTNRIVSQSIRIKEITMINDLFDFVIAAVNWVLEGVAVAPGLLSSIVIG